MVTFPDDILDKAFAALAHPTRRAILTRLALGEVASVSELAEPFDVSLMAISKHLKVMEEAGLIRRERDGRVQRCSYEPEAASAAAEWLELHRRYWEGRLDSLARYLERPKPEGGEGARRGAGAPEEPTRHDSPENEGEER